MRIIRSEITNRFIRIEFRVIYWFILVFISFVECICICIIYRVINENIVINGSEKRFDSNANNLLPVIPILHINGRSLTQSALDLLFIWFIESHKNISVASVDDKNAFGLRSVEESFRDLTSLLLVVLMTIRVNGSDRMRQLTQDL